MYGPKVLELACGTGRITLPLYESGVDIDGLDFSDSMLRVARDRSETKSFPINFILGDIRSLSFHDQYRSSYRIPRYSLPKTITFFLMVQQKMGRSS